MKLTKNLISRDEALKISKVYVAWAEKDYDKWEAVNKAFSKLKKGQAVLTCFNGQFVLAKVSSIKDEPIAEDGPVVRVTNGEYSWRVDGNEYAFPVKT